MVVVFWLAIIFASFGLFAPRNASVTAALFVAALSVAGSIYLILASSVVARFMSVRTPRARQHPSVTLLKPLHFDSAGLEEDLTTFLVQDYPAPIQIVFVPAATWASATAVAALAIPGRL